MPRRLNMENIKRREQVAVLIDWQVRVSREVEVGEVKPMNLDPNRIRLNPVYLPTGELTMVVPAVSEESAREKAGNIARHIVSVGLWGIEIWDPPEFVASIERFL
jgi:hypothetical protein